VNDAAPRKQPDTAARPASALPSEGTGEVRDGRDNNRSANRIRGSKATLSSVASLAGVSKQTVSNVLNSPHLVRSDTAERVKAAIAELSYRPHQGAQQLRTRRSQLLGLRIHQVPDPTVLDRFLHAVTDIAAESDYRIILYTAADDDREIDTYAELLDRWNIDGLVLSSTHSGDRRTRHLSDQGVPFVSFGRPWDGPHHHSWVDVDGRAGTRSATEQLITAGHRRIGFIGWPEGSETGDDRLSGWADALSAAGLARPEPRRGTNDFPSGWTAATDLLRGDDVTAMVCVSDQMGLGALSAARDAGRAVGSEFSIIGFDNSDAAVAANLSSLSQPLRLVADNCLRIVFNQIQHPGEGPAPEHVLLAPTLELRGSTGHPG